MRSRLLASLVALAVVAGPAATTAAASSCGTEVVILKGRIENPPRDATVRVQLLYAKKQQEQLEKEQEQSGESGEVTVENGRFTIQIPFLNQYREPVIFAEFRHKGDRKPQTVVVTQFYRDITSSASPPYFAHANRCTPVGSSGGYGRRGGVAPRSARRTRSLTKSTSWI